MDDRNNVHEENDVMDVVEQFVRDGMTKVRRHPNQQHKGEDDVSSDHDFHGEFVAKRLVPLRAQQPKEEEEEDRCNEYDQYHGVPQMDMHP
jgi:hypothetical protein